MLGIKQEALAITLGEDWSQKRVSLMEQKETIENNLLEQVAAIFKIPVEAIENLDEEQAVNIIANTFHTNDNATVGIGGNSGNGDDDNRIFHPIDKLVQLHEEKITLYERMLKEKDDIIDRLEN
ncbi:XRE family transcriptional regulator [Flavobacterium sp. WV_118_3]|uniref:XRE family transcriptional regulator n=1 Tax=Flavobacterium sp. WV_118_3 TaxID=3151764 RepID=UPI0032198ED4